MVQATFDSFPADRRGSMRRSSALPLSMPVAAKRVRSWLLRAYLAAGVGLAIFGVGYGLSRLDSGRCGIGWSCAANHALLLAAFLAAALAAMVFAAHLTKLGLSWFVITTGLAGLVLVTGAPLLLLIALLALVPGLAAIPRVLLSRRS